MTPCHDCHAGCCRSFAVPLTGADILRIERDLRLDFWQFVCRWADPEGRIARTSAPHFQFPDEPQTPFVICLMHAESEFLTGSTRCRFLREGAPDEAHPLGVARCGIYAHRPAACRCFPLRSDPAGELVILDERPREGARQGHAAYELCPRPWEPSDVDPLSAPQDLAIARYEMAFFRRIAEVWNHSPRSWHIFPEFLRLIYANRVIAGTDEVIGARAAAA
ncbi:MAG: YkgJ family cysteine cluster protein [Planctomycetes bacterium]|nr:YkgJ family cysteine cluster protein [Planctomycetota bacterium]